MAGVPETHRVPRQSRCVGSDHAAIGRATGMEYRHLPSVLRSGRDAAGGWSRRQALHAAGPSVAPSSPVVEGSCRQMLPLRYADCMVFTVSRRMGMIHTYETSCFTQ